jgi:4'-phosphopantetheinyl transferase
LAEPTDDVHVYYRFTESLTEQELEAAAALLSAGEREKRSRRLKAPDRRDYTVAHALLREALSAHGPAAPADWTFVVNGHGKPSLAPASHAGVDLSFSLSHTAGLAVCAIAPGADVGIDVELADRAVDARSIAERYFSAIDRSTLAACEDSGFGARFAEIWTLKEAYIKALGTGLAHGLATFGFLFEGDNGLSVAGDAVDTGEWQFALFACGNYRMAVAVRSGRRTARTIAVRGDPAPWKLLRRTLN